MRTTEFEHLTITSTPIPATYFAELQVIAGGDAGGMPGATAMASFQRDKRAEHEEMWCQLFVDDVFADVVRVLEIDQGTGESVFMARFKMPEIYFDGAVHHARARFVTTISRIVPARTVSASADDTARTETTPAAEAEAEFRAVFAVRAATR